MDHAYAREKMTAAVYALASGGSTLEERVLRAFLSFHTLTSQDLPEHLQKDFLWVYESFHDGRLIEERSQQVRELADKICDMAFQLHSDQGRD